MTKDEIIKDLEAQIQMLKIANKLQEEIINLYKNKQNIVLNPIWPLQPTPEPLQPFATYIGDVIPNPVKIT
jgi:hypothetical protein